ncbi:MAG: hypothetical protein JWQ66_3839 [Mucilaginibacter sp.]|nr:hypothetical protein [Mucilaginibacter sp.]
MYDHFLIFSYQNFNKYQFVSKKQIDGRHIVAKLSVDA